jgi:hypothetical protein
MGFGLFGFVVVALAVGLMFPTAPGCGEIYRWVDENGTVWVTDDPAKLPEESGDQFEKLKAPKETPDSAAQEKASRPRVPQRATRRSADVYLQRQNQRAVNIEGLEAEIASLENDLGLARQALRRLRVSDQRGYWYVIDGDTGKKTRATYKDPGARWSTATWPELPRAERTPEAEERKRIEGDVTKMEADLEKAKKELSSLRRSL